MSKEPFPRIEQMSCVYHGRTKGAPTPPNPVSNTYIITVKCTDEHCGQLDAFPLLIFQLVISNLLAWNLNLRILKFQNVN